MSTPLPMRLASLAALLMALAGAWPARGEWAVVNRPVSPLLDRPGIAGEARELLYPGMRVRLLDGCDTPGYVRAAWGERTGYMRSHELLRGFLPEDDYPGPADHPEAEFLTSDRDADGEPDYQDIVHAARDMLGLPFDDASSLRLDESGQTPDGLHASWAADGRDNNGDGVADDRDEDVMVCIDLLLRAVEKAGYPMTRAVREMASARPELFGEGGSGRPIDDEFLTRRVRNVVAFARSSPDFRYFPEPQIHEPTAYPRERARPGDLLFFGLTRDLGTRKFKVQHSGICVSVSPVTGLPVWMITAVVPRVQFFNLEKGYHRFVYCGHARLMPPGRAPVAMRKVSPIRIEPALGAPAGPAARVPWVHQPLDGSAPAAPLLLPLMPFAVASPIGR